MTERPSDVALQSLAIIKQAVVQGLIRDNSHVRAAISALQLFIETAIESDPFIETVLSDVDDVTLLERSYEKMFADLDISKIKTAPIFHRPIQAYSFNEPWDELRVGAPAISLKAHYDDDSREFCIRGHYWKIVATVEKAKTFVICNDLGLVCSLTRNTDVLELRSWILKAMRFDPSINDNAKQVDAEIVQFSDQSNQNPIVD